MTLPVSNAGCLAMTARGTKEMIDLGSPLGCVDDRDTRATCTLLVDGALRARKWMQNEE